MQTGQRLEFSFKVQSADFVVEELVNVHPDEKGRYSLYRVRKQEITTDAMLREMARWMRKPIHYFRHAGMKDRYAVCYQHVSVKGDGPEEINAPSFTALRIGYLDRHLKPTDIAGNRFRLILRDLRMEEYPVLERNVNEVTRWGAPNYFDDQRFASQKDPKRAFGFFLFRRQFEEALRVYATEILPESGHLPAKTAREINENWGNWLRITARIRRPAALKKAFAYLQEHPADFQGAVYRLPLVDLRMMVSAAQAFLWNEMVIRYLEHHVPPDRQIWIPGAWNRYVFYRSLSGEERDEWQNLQIPMPHANFQGPAAEWDAIFLDVLERHNLDRNHLYLPGLRKIFLGEFSRPLLVFPRDVQLEKPQPDPLAPGKFMVQLSFRLPRGSYATIIVKRLQIRE